MGKKSKQVARVSTMHSGQLDGSDAVPWYNKDMCQRVDLWLWTRPVQLDETALCRTLAGDLWLYLVGAKQSTGLH